MKFRIVVAIGLLFASLATFASPAETRGAETVVHMLDYVGVDYPEFVRNGRVVDETEYREQLEFAGQAIEGLRALPERPGKSDLVAGAERLRARIEARAPGAEVSRLAAEVRQSVMRTYALAVAPRAVPDATQAQTLYASHCAGCHGAEGRGNGPAAARLDPPPSNFHEAARMASRSVHGLYQTISLGVPGTAMTAFRDLSDDERWALAFYVARLGADPEGARRGEALWHQGVAHALFPDLGAVATQTYRDVAREHGAEAASVLGWLIANPSAVATNHAGPIATSRSLLNQSVEAYRNGRIDEAQQLAIKAYLDGFELAEASLAAVDRDLMTKIEHDMMRYREQLRAGASVSAIETQARALTAALDQAEQRLAGNALSPATAAVSAFVILLREGLEAILVVAAIVAFLVKGERREALRYVHFGWIGALALGAVTWFAAQFLIEITGAAREMTEGLTALLAAGILLYVGFWLHSKAYAGRWQEFIAAHLKGALSRGTVWALVGVSFLAVYREAFETVLFYQALWTQAGPPAQAAVLGGFVGAAVALAAVSWAIFRYGVRLPIGPFFAVSSILLAVLAVIFVGQGIAALQEAGRIPADTIGIGSLPMLGIYPTVQTLGAQALLLTIVIAGFAYSYLARRPSQAAL